MNEKRTTKNKQADNLLVESKDESGNCNQNILLNNEEDNNNNEEIGEKYWFTRYYTREKCSRFGFIEKNTNNKVPNNSLVESKDESGNHNQNILLNNEEDIINDEEIGEKL